MLELGLLQLLEMAAYLNRLTDVCAALGEGYTVAHWLAKQAPAQLLGGFVVPTTHRQPDDYATFLQVSLLACTFVLGSGCFGWNPTVACKSCSLFAQRAPAHLLGGFVVPTTHRQLDEYATFLQVSHSTHEFARSPAAAGPLLQQAASLASAPHMQPCAEAGC